MKKISLIVLIIFSFIAMMSCSFPTDNSTSDDTCPIIPSGNGDCD